MQTSRRYTIEELRPYVGDTVRLRPTSGSNRNAHRAGRLLRIEGSRLVVKPWNHHKEEVVEADEVVPFLGRSTLDHTSPSTGGMLWVLADASTPRYLSDSDEGWVGNPAEALTFSTMPDSREGHGNKQLFPMPLEIAVERYAATIPEVITNETLVEVKTIERVEVPVNSSPVEQMGALITNLRAAEATRDASRIVYEDAKNLYDQAHLEVEKIQRDIGQIKQAFDAVFRGLSSSSGSPKSDFNDRYRRIHEGSTTEYLLRVMEEGKIYSASTLVEPLMKAGWTTGAHNKVLAVGQCLTTRSDLFDRRGVGLYQITPQALAARTLPMKSAR